MRIAKAGYPFVAGAAGASILLLLLGIWPLAAVAAVLAGYMAYFFRDPERTTPRGADVVLAPGDGRLMAVAEGSDGRTAFSIFLGLLDVHVNRAPADGTVRTVEHVRGKFRAAFREEAGEVNEQYRVTFDTAAGPLEMRQVVGMAARRIEFWAEPGQTVTAGERIGIMKFGSRIDLLLPPGSSIEARPGQKVRAGETILARLAVSGARG